jgi:hypothetical protein
MAKIRPFALDGIWLPAIAITLINVGLFWVTFASIAGK